MLIGLSVNHKEGTSRIADAYVNAVIQAGGTPVLIPVTNDTRVLDAILLQIDGLILSGGGDIHASFFNEELHPTVDDCDLLRDESDLYLVRKSAEIQLPILGICRGHQVINVAFGGTLIQDIPSQVPDSQIHHSQDEAREIGTHEVTIVPDSKLYNTVIAGLTRNPLIKQSNKLPVNSFHHQAVKDIAPNFKVVAKANDGIIEAIESTEEKTIIGVQWHPENMAVAGNETMMALFHYIIKESELFYHAKEIHKKIYSIDSHCDTPMHFNKGINIAKNNLQVDIPKMQAGMLDAIFMVAYLKQGERDDKMLQATVEKTENTIKELIRQVEINKDSVEIAHSSDDLKRIKATGKKAIFIGIENGYGLGKNIRNVEKFAQMGVRYITLSHNGDNDICDSAKGNTEHNGLSEYGKEVVREMNRLGILVDISHTSEKSSFDALEVSRYPIIASHSSAKALCNHPRNVSDQLMHAIADKGGVIQVCLYSEFLLENGEATVKDAVNHIDYIVKTIGIDHVGIGSDFDGGGGIKGLNAANELPQITLELLRRGYSDEDIEQIWGGNLMRVMDIVIKK